MPSNDIDAMVSSPPRGREKHILKFALSVLAQVLGTLIAGIATYYFTKYWLNTPGGSDLLCSPIQTLQTVPIAARDYEIPIGEISWTEKAGRGPIRIEKAFRIMQREVSVGDLNDLLDRRSSSNLHKLQLWRAGQREHTDHAQPARGISHEVAQEVARALTQETGCIYRLPTYNQWVVATHIFGDENVKALGRQEGIGRLQSRSNVATKVFDLRANLREWSSEVCSTDGLQPKYVTLGEDFLTPIDQYAASPRCTAYASEQIGFRLVVVEEGKS